MTVALLNIIAIIGYSVHSMRGRRGWLGFLTLTAITAAFCFGRTKLLLSVPMGQMRLTIVNLLPFVILPFWVVTYRKINKNTLPLLGLIFFITLVSLLSFLIRGQRIVWMIYSWLSFAGPMLLGVYAGNLDDQEAYQLADNIKQAILLLALIGLVSTQLAPSGVAGLLGWEHQGSLRLVTPVGGAIASGATMLLIWPRVLSVFLMKRSLLSFCEVSLLVVTFLLTGSRAIIFVLVIVTLMTALVNMFSQFNLRKMLVRSMKAIIVLVLFGMGAYLLGQTQPVRRLMIGFGGTSFLLRSESARTAAKLVAKQPLIGHVPGHTYSWFYTDYDDSIQHWIWLGDGASLPEPHNTYLMLAVDYGILVLIFFIAVMLLMMITQAKRATIWQNHFGVYNSLGIFAFLFQALGSSHLLVKPQVAVLFWLIYGSSLARVKGIDKA